MLDLKSLLVSKCVLYWRMRERQKDEFLGDFVIVLLSLVVLSLFWAKMSFRQRRHGNESTESHMLSIVLGVA
jgi:hypothetical protein